MKQLLLLFFLGFTLPLLAFVRSMPLITISEEQGMEIVSELPAEMSDLSIGEFLTLTPKTYREKTGKRLNYKERRQMRHAQQRVKVRMGKNKRAASDISMGVYILLALLALGWLGIGLLTDFEGSDWVIALILYVLFYLPGLIYTLIKMGDYY